MEIRRLLYYAVNCALVCYIVAKPYSLNKLIEAESTQKLSHTTFAPNTQESEPAAERFSLNKGLKPFTLVAKKFKETDTKLHLIPLGKKISPLKYKKAFQIKSPLKPKRVKTSLRTRHKRKNQSFKGEINSNAILNKKYVPLLRSLGMLFDNILGPDSGESVGTTKHKKRLRFYPDGDDDLSCTCPRQKPNATKRESEEEAITFTETIAPKAEIATEVASKITNNSSVGNIRNFRHNKNISVLLSRNTFGAWRNNSGIGERGGTAHNGSTERHIARNNGDSKYHSEYGQKQSYAESDDNYTDGTSRNGTGRFGTRGKIRRREHRNSTEEVYEDNSTSQDETEKLSKSGKISQHYGADKHKAERNKAKSGKFLSEPVREQREFLFTNEITDFAEPVQSKENYKESLFSIPFNSTSNQRFVDRNGSHSSEIEEADAETETEIAREKLGKVPLERESAIKGNDNNFTHRNHKSNSGKRDLNASYDMSEESMQASAWKVPDFVEITTETELHHESTVELSDTSNKLKPLNTDLKEDIHTEEKRSDSSEHENYDQHKNNTKRKPTNTLGSDHKLLENSLHFLKSSKSSKTKGPVVMIIDGYSVTRHKNGENKLAEKTIRIRH